MFDRRCYIRGIATSSRLKLTKNDAWKTPLTKPAPQTKPSNSKRHRTIRLNRDDIYNSLVVHAKIAASVRLAEMIVARMKSSGG